MDLQYPPPPKRGVLVVFEGLNGAGKSTCLSAVAAKLREVSPDTPVVETKEPTSDTPIGRLLRRVLAGEETLADPLTFQALCAADRLEHAATVLRPAMERGAIVLCDRYVLSSVAYCPTGRLAGKYGDPTSERHPWFWVHDMNRFAPKADLTVVLRVPPHLAEARVLARDGHHNSLAGTADPQAMYGPPRWGEDWSHSVATTSIDGTLPQHALTDIAVTEILSRIRSLIDDKGSA